MVSKDKVGDSFGSKSITPINLESVLYMEQCGTSELPILNFDVYMFFIVINLIDDSSLDRYDEGTAFMPIVEHKRNLPVSDKYQFLSLDEDGFDVPSDW